MVGKFSYFWGKMLAQWKDYVSFMTAQREKREESYLSRSLHSSPFKSPGLCVSSVFGQHKAPVLPLLTVPSFRLPRPLVRDRHCTRGAKRIPQVAFRQFPLVIKTLQSFDRPASGGLVLSVPRQNNKKDNCVVVFPLSSWFSPSWLPSDLTDDRSVRVRIQRSEVVAFMVKR